MSDAARELFAGDPPRATRIRLPHRPEIGTEIWMGGSDSLIGESVSLDVVSDAVVIDCAGNLPHAYRTAAGQFLSCVFLDAEVVPFSFDRVAGLVHELATAVTAAAGTDAAGAPRRVFVFCQYGLNRSGLVTGLLLRALGEAADAAVAGVRLARPGALNNLTFSRLIADWRCPEAPADPSSFASR